MYRTFVMQQSYEDARQEYLAIADAEMADVVVFLQAQLDIPIADASCIDKLLDD